MTTDARPGARSPLPIDVIVPAWGSRYAGTLPGALASAARAARRTVVGDEGCLAIAAEHGAERLVAVQNRHPGAARNLGLAETTLPFVLFLDADDELLPGALERLYDRLSTRPHAVAAAGLLRREPGGTFWPPAGQARLACLPLGGALLLFKNVLPAVGAVLIRRSAIRGGPLFPSLDDEDWHAAMRLRLSGRVDLAMEPVATYRVSSGSVSRRSRSATALAASRSALLPVAEDVLGRRSPLLRMLNPFARIYRNRNDRRLLQTWGAR